MFPFLSFFFCEQKWRKLKKLKNEKKKIDKMKKKIKNMEQ
jgi:hypothetical protein